MSEKTSPADRPDRVQGEIPSEVEHEAPRNVVPAGGGPERGPQEEAPPRAEAPSEAVDAVAEPTPEERIAGLEDRLQRVKAEFVNESKRIQRQADERVRYATDGLLEDLLPVFDALHSARDGFAARAEADEAAAGALEGFDIVEKEMLNVLSRHGVTPIDATEGVVFDPSIHHAIVMLEVPGRTAGTVAKELRPGFMLHERVVRPSHVAVVAERPEAEETARGDAEDDARDGTTA